MRSTIRSRAYTLLGLAVWKSAKFYVNTNYGKYIPSRRQTLIGALVLAVVGGALAGVRQTSSS
jgi:hypothetical protein